MHLSGAHGSQEPDDGERLVVAVEVLGLLADRTRLALLRRLGEGEGEGDVTTLTESREATRTSASQHLARLRPAGLVPTRNEGRRVVHGLRPGHLRHLVDEALNVADHRIGHLPPHDSARAAQTRRRLQGPPSLGRRALNEACWWCQSPSA